MSIKRIFLLILLFSVALILFFKFINKHDHSVKTPKDYPQEIIQKSPESCGRLPLKDEIIIENVWQIFKTPKGIVRLLNAYLDTRTKESVVRINANGIKLEKGHSVYCQLFYDDNNPPEVVKVSEFIPMWNQSISIYSYKNRPFFINCPLKVDKGRVRIPQSVSLTLDACAAAHNNLNVINNQPEDGKPKEFGVCTLDLSYDDQTFGARYTEWLHLLKILGAHKIHLYNNIADPDFVSVLKLFEEKGTIEMKDFSSPTDVHDDNMNDLLELNMLNDCFYRVKNLYNFVVILDYKEAIIPVKPTDRTWHDLMKNIDQSVIVDLYSSSNVYFKETEQIADISGYHHMLHRIERADNFVNPRSHVRSFIVPENILLLTSQSTFTCLAEPCTDFLIPGEISRNYNYMSHEVEAMAVTVTDTTIWKYKDELIELFKGTLRDLNLLNDPDELK